MKIAVGMSGGVDSSVVAKILKNEGHEVVGLFLKLWSDPTTPCGLRGAGRQNRCCDYEALEDARAVAGKLDIPFYVINAKDEFKKDVVDYFLKEYSALRTPNPCIVCNDKIKFDLLLKRALSLGCDHLATGHYARISVSHFDESSRRNLSVNDGILTSPFDKLRVPQDDKIGYHLLAGTDKEKDQSYMLYRLSQYQLSKTLFPLGEMTKKIVRAKAVEWDLPVKEKPESQEICFVGDRDYRSFLKRYLPEKYFKPGEIVDNAGNILGEHQGLINYTIGQRKGIEQSQKSPPKRDLPSGGKVKNENPDREPLYVIGLDVKKNQLIVGEDKETFSKEMTVADLHWIGNTSEPGLDSSEVGEAGLMVKIRYRHPAVRCNIKNKISPPKGDLPLGGNIKNIEVLFKEPQRAVTPGQSAVFYGGDLSREASAKWEEVLGGGVIIS